MDSERAKFDVAVEKVLLNEGGFVDHPNDPGGATNHGVSLRFLRSLKVARGDIDLNGVVDAADIRALTVQGAKDLYWEHWWHRYRYGELPSEIADKVLDLSIWMGPGRAHRLLQQALRASGHPVKVDGALGPKSRAAVSSAPSLAVLAALRSEAAGFLRLLMDRRPSSRIFKGWLRRAYQSS